MNFIRRFVRRIVNAINVRLKVTPWYRQKFIDYNHEIYPTESWAGKKRTRNYDIVNVGSSSAYWAFDYDGLPIKAMNWAQPPQWLQNDLRILKNFHSILKDGGTVIIPLCFFSCFYIDDSVEDSLRYAQILDPILMDTRYKNRILQLTYSPIHFGKIALRVLLSYIKRRGHYDYSIPLDKRKTCEHNLMNAEQIAADAEMWINGWKSQFNIKDLEAPLSQAQRESQEKQAKILAEIILFCRERGYYVYCLIPPVTSTLGTYFTPSFMTQYVFNFIRMADASVPILDYSHHQAFADNDLYFNSFFLNLRGRKLFTQRVLADLGIVK